jgi:lipoprotein NlpD
MGISRIRFGVALTVALLLQACSTQSPAPIEAPGQKQVSPAIAPSVKSAPAAKQAPSSQPMVRNGRYTVQSGDTLHAIAWRLGVDHRRIIEWNALRNPDRIMVGQSLIVAPPSSAPQASRPPTPVAPAAPTLPPESPAPALAAPPAAADSRGRWVWPADGKARRSVSATGSSGLQIRGKRGQQVKAAAAGEVVYSGSGLRGYGQLLILKHDEVYLSAYAHNDKLLVQEGQRVERGQAIALMGDSGASEVMLHFEIRKGGKAVDPTAYLPAR